MIDLLNLEENKVSRDLSGYSIVFMGDTGSGKTDSMNRFLTSVAPKGKVPLFLMFEDRHKAIQGIMAQRVSSISEVTQIVGQLKNPKVRDRFSCIVVDTMDKFEEMASRYQAQNKEVEIIEDLNYGKGKRYLNASIGMLTEIRNLGLPVHFICQSYTTTGMIDKKTLTQTKLKDTTKAQIFHDAFLVGAISQDFSNPDPLHADRLVSFRRNSEYIELKDTFGLPEVMKVAEIKSNLEALFDSKYDKEDLTNDAVIGEIVEEHSFEDIIKKGTELGGVIANSGRLDEALNIMKLNIGTTDDGSAKMFDSLNSSQIDLAKVVVIKLEELVEKYNLK